MEILMKRRQFILEAKCLKVWTWGSWKSRHQNVSPSCLQLATKHMGEEEDSACSEWSSCYTRGTAVLRIPSSRHTNIPEKQMYNHAPCLHAPPLHGAVALTSGWLHTASWKWGLSWSAFDKSCLRCQCVSCVSLSAKAFHVDTLLQGT